MSGLSQFFGWSSQGDTGSDELPEIFPLAISQLAFVKIDIRSIFTKILTDVLERTHGLAEDLVPLMWDSCVMSNSAEGLVSRLAAAMAEKQELFLVFEKAVGVVRLATQAEISVIRADYAKSGQSPLGIFVSFKNFDRSDMVKFYLALQYCTVGSLHKSMNLSKAIQIKISDLRSSVSLVDASVAKAQAQAMAKALGAGRDVLMDVKDEITTTVPDLKAVKEAIEFLDQKQSFYLGLPASYLSGEQTAGIGSSGENDMRAVERGLRGYFFSIIKPVLENLFQGTKVSYKSQDFRQILASMDALKTFALVDDSLVSAENKRIILNGMLGLSDDAKGDEPAAPPPAQTPARVTAPTRQVP